MNNDFVAPTPDEIRETRYAAGLSQTKAAHLVYAALRTWQDWEAGKKIDPARWELFNIKISKESEKPR